ncbi:MAG: flagellar assembly peptidoglycan hydrolase FlgJ [Burkholderiaceae bacterium]
MDSGGLGVDARSLNSLRRQAGENPREAVRQAAEQFEALFMRQLLKTMRASIPQGGITGSAGEKMAQEMLDDRLSTHMVGQPGGLTDTLVRHLSHYMPEGKTPDVMAPQGAPSLLSFRADRTASLAGTTVGQIQRNQSNAAINSQDISSNAMPAALAEALAAGRGAQPTTREGRFVERLWDHAKAAEQATGVPASFILGQAALESGWGKGEMRHADGRPAFNLFGIKAGSRWQGETVEVMTTEYVNGNKVRQTDHFRAYNSYEESFNDWINLMTRHPRYENVLLNATSPASFAQGLQSAGYATDPAYADKLQRVIQRTIELQQELV